MSCRFFVNPNYVAKTGCTAKDIELLKLLIPHAYEQNRSAIRPDARIRHARYIEHRPYWKLSEIFID